MMMRKMMALLMSIALLMAALPAMAESIFPPFPQATVETKEAPSYGALMGEVPRSETNLPDGSLRQVYADVTQEDFNSFGVYLAEEQYALDNYAYVSATVLSADVVKGSLRFMVLYDWEKQELTVTYPAGVQAEAIDFFRGYTRIDWEETIRFGSLVRFTPKSFTYNTVNWGNYCLLNVNASNITRERIATTDVFDAESGIQTTLHFINEIDHYTYDVRSVGVRVVSFGDSVLRDQFIPSLESKDFSAAFALPGNVFNSDEGTLALTFTYGEDAYVLFIREAAD